MRIIRFDNLEIYKLKTKTDIIRYVAGSCKFNRQFVHLFQSCMNICRAYAYLLQTEKLFVVWVDRLFTKKYASYSPKIDIQVVLAGVSILR